MLQENQSYKAQLIGLEVPEGKNMRTLKIAIPSEEIIFKGVSVFLDNTKNASKTLDIWLRNIARQNNMKIKVPSVGHIEYLQEMNGEFKDENPEDIAVEKMITMLEQFAKDKVKFDVTYVRTFSEKHEDWFVNLLPYVPQDAPVQTEGKSKGFKTNITK